MRTRKFTPPSKATEDNSAETTENIDDEQPDDEEEDTPVEAATVGSDSPNAPAEASAAPTASAIPRPPPGLSDFVSRWFLDVRAPREHANVHFIPRALLLMVYALVDVDNGHHVHINELMRRLPPAVVNDGLSTLRILRYIDFDGVTVTLLRLPELRELTKENHA